MTRLASREERLETIKDYSWVHTIDLGEGLSTPGRWPKSRLIGSSLDQIDFTGKKVLDVGCWDGLWSFEAEKRGAAEVHAIDDISQRPNQHQPTFELARSLLNSNVKYYPNVSVYHVDQLGIHDFDIVLFAGVYYHLRHPLLALARLRQVMREGAAILVEGVVFDSPEISAHFFYRNHHANDRTNWWIPTIPCLREWVESSSFTIESELRASPSQTTRYAILARARTGNDPDYGVPDEDLAQFNMHRPRLASPRRPSV